MYFKDIESDREVSRQRDEILKKNAADRLRGYQEYKRKFLGGGRKKSQD